VAVREEVKMAAVCFVSPLVLPVEDVPLLCCVEGKHKNLGLVMEKMLSKGWKDLPLHTTLKEMTLTAFDRSGEIEDGSKFLIVVTDCGTSKRSWNDLLLILCNEFNLVAESFDTDRSKIPEFVPVLSLNGKESPFLTSYLDMYCIAKTTLKQWGWGDFDWEERVDRLVDLIYPSQHVDRLAFLHMAQTVNMEQWEADRLFWAGDESQFYSEHSQFHEEYDDEHEWY
jgi:hypothetical protein